MIVASAALVLAFSALAQDVADNTERNLNERSNQTLTPIVQGTDKADLAPTAKIRKEIMAENNLSVNAQNVKIITHALKVTLRGPVDTSKEKRLIGEIAVRHAPLGTSTINWK